MSPRGDDVLPTSTSVETYTRWAGEERIGRNTKRRVLQGRASSKSAPMQRGRTPTWRERISCLVKFHGTMDGTRVAVCKLQPSFNQYSRYMYRSERFPTLGNLMQNFTSELRRSFRICCRSGLFFRESEHFFLSIRVTYLK